MGRVDVLMATFWVVLSGENPPLAHAELGALVESLGGTISRARSADSSIVDVELANEGSAKELAARIALARRVVEEWAEEKPTEVIERLRSIGASGGTGAFRIMDGRGRKAIESPLKTLAESYRDAGGSIDLETPTHRFWCREMNGALRVGEEVATIDRAAFRKRAMPTLPFRRPVSLAPRLARVAANLARFRTGGRVIDPFLGTGALAIELALLNGRVTGIDRDARMVQGATRNFAALGLSAERLVVADAELAAREFRDEYFDALVTDPPYGRASASGGETPAHLSSRVLTAWAPKIRPEGRIVTVTPGGPETLPSQWERELSISDRVHRSLTREFRVYRRRR